MEENCTSYIRLLISHEEVQNISIMTKDAALSHLGEWYAIDTSRILSLEIIEELSKQPILKIKLKIKIEL